MAQDLHALVAKIIGCHVHDVHDHSDFFELGGDSVAAMRLANEARSIGLSGMSIPIVYDHPMIRDMVEACRAGSTKDHGPTKEASQPPQRDLSSATTMIQHWSLVNDCMEQTGISAEAIEDIYPCLEIQDRLLPLMFPNVLTVPATEETRLKVALETLYQSDPLLRTRLFRHHNSLYQVVIRGSIAWHEDPGPLEDYQTCNKRHTMRTGEPMSRCAIVRSKGKTHVIWTLSHAITDRTSRRILFDLLGDFWQNAETSPKKLPSFKSLVEWTNDSKNHEPGLKFWSDQLQGLIRFDVHHDIDLQPSWENTMFMRKERPKVTHPLPGITLATVAHVSWALALAGSSGLANIFFKSLRSGRQIPGLQDLGTTSGPVTCTVPFLLSLTNRNQQLKEFLQQTQVSMVRGFAQEPFALEAMARHPKSKHMQQSVFVYNGEEVGRSRTIAAKVGEDEREETLLEMSESVHEGWFSDPPSVYVSVGPGDVLAVYDHVLVPQDKMAGLLQDWIDTFEHIQKAAPWNGMTLGDILPGNISTQLKNEEVAQAAFERAPKTLASIFNPRTNDLSVILPHKNASSSLEQAKLRNCVEKLQSQIAQLHLQAGSTVILAIPNSLEFVVAFLAIVSLRHIIAPINPALKKEEMDFYLEDIDAMLVIVPKGDIETDSAAVRSARENKVTMAELEIESGKLFFDVMEREERDVGVNGYHDVEPQENDVALILHTSGTTGRPKAVPLTHKNLITSADNLCRTYDLTAQDRTMLIMPLYHIHGIVASFLATLRSGGTIVIPPRLTPSFWKDFQDHHATWYTATPTMHNLIMNYDIGDESQFNGPRFIRSCSSALSPALFARLEKKFKCPILESYAMTEASHLMASNPLPPGCQKPGYVGLHQGIELELRDDNGQPIAADAEGEVCIRGENVTKGYLNNPDANKSAFWDDGFFRTGDQGRLDEDGYLTLTGRLKEFINKGGEKISPIEIDNVFSQHDDVNEVVCFAMEDDLYGQDVGAAVRLKEGRDVDVESLRKWLSSRVAAYKLPRKIWLLDEIPKTATGKVQRRLVAEQVSQL